MHTFETFSEAQDFMRLAIDVPVAGQAAMLSSGMQLQTYAQELPGGRFTNIYDVSYRPEAAAAAIHSCGELGNVYGHVAGSQAVQAAMSGGFIFLADRYQARPRQLALNLAVDQGKVLNLPVTDREAVVVEHGNLSARQVRALGELSLNGRTVSWAGSTTGHEADCTVYGNGNSRITHQTCPWNGSMRVLDERSRLTPTTDNPDVVDVGLIRQDDGSFRSIAYKDYGGLDIFGYDAVLRCPKEYLDTADGISLQVRTIDTLSVGSGLQGALTAGPMLHETDFAGHPINSDQSLGSHPPFSERPKARTLLYQSADGRIHMRLMDGRPGSETFTGVTPTEAAGIVLEEIETLWGCFMDPGQSAKLCVRSSGQTISYGNRHYLQWPEHPGDKYVWTPDGGRSSANLIAVQ